MYSGIRLSAYDRAFLIGSQIPFPVLLIAPAKFELKISFLSAVTDPKIQENELPGVEWQLVDFGTDESSYCDGLLSEL